VPKTVISQIKKDGEYLVRTSVKFAQDLWASMRKTDFTSFGILNFKIVENLYESYKTQIQGILKIDNASDFFEIFDQDNDGFLNEDE
jgi:hypothetical protein